MWLDGAPRMDTKKHMFKSDWTTCSQNLITVLDSIVNIIVEGGGEREST